LSFGQTSPLKKGVEGVFAIFFLREIITSHTGKWLRNWWGDESYDHGYNSIIFRGIWARGFVGGNRRLSG